MPSKITTVVFPLAGFGTRFLPATKSVSKELLPILNRPLIDYALEEALLAGMERFIFITQGGNPPLETYVSSHPILEAKLLHFQKTQALEDVRKCTLSDGQAVFIRQDEPKGMGHTLALARTWIGQEPFCVISPDELMIGKPSCLQEMVQFYHTLSKGSLAAVMDVPHNQTHHYGILDIAEDHTTYVTARSLIEKPSPGKAPSSTAIVGRYILPPDIFDAIAHQKPGAGEEIQLTDAIVTLMKTHPFYGFRFSGQRFDCGQLPGWLEANLTLAYAHPQLKETVKTLVHTLSSKEIK